MKASRQFRLGWTTVVVIGCVLGAAVLGWAARQEHASGLKAQTALRAKIAERDLVVSESPQPSEATEKSLREELTAVQQATAAVSAVLAGHSPEALEIAVPAKSVDAYFELSSYVEKNRTLAAVARLSLVENERFGFSIYQAEGPADDVLPAVAKQMTVLRHVLECLFESTPQALLAVQRERPLTTAQQATRRAGGEVRVAPASAEMTKDYFAIDPTLSLFVPGQTETLAFRVEFVGRTPSLRGFLNSLAAFKLPLFVRSVEVEPLASVATTSTPEVGETGASLPVVAHNVSKFAVVVELVELVHRPTNP